MSQSLSVQILGFINQYLQMDLGKITVNCPYWSNKIKSGSVVIRGFQNGKGAAEEIKTELQKRLPLGNLNEDLLTSLYIQKFAKKERIGIDCSGLAFRVLEELARLRYKNYPVDNLTQVFPEGITRVNVKKLTDIAYCTQINDLKEVQTGDLIRMMGGKHVVVIIKSENNLITYIHSSNATSTKGVHLSYITIRKGLPLEKQNWQEKTKKGENFGLRYYYPNKGDGIFRLKIFS